MPKQNVRFRQHTTVEYSTNNRVSEKLQRGMLIRRLMLQLEGAPTLTGANNTSAKAKKGDEWAVVKNIRIVANGTDVIYDISGNDLWWWNFFQYGTPPTRNEVLGDASTANPTFNSILLLDFESPDMKSPIDTILDSANLSDLTVEVQWGTFTDINGDATAWTTNPTLKVYAVESFMKQEVFPSQKRLYQITQDIAANNTKHKVELVTGVGYRGFLLNMDDAGADDPTLINNVKVKSGTTVFYDLDTKIIQELIFQRKGITRGYTGQVYDDLRVSDSNDVEGWWFVDLCPARSYTEMIDTAGFSEIHLEIDIEKGGGTTQLKVIPIEIVPIRGNPQK